MVKYWSVLVGLSLGLLIVLASPLAAAKETHPASSAWFDQPLLLQTEPISETEPLLEVAITDDGIFPPILTIPSGTTIRWTNQTSQTQRLEGTVSAFDPESVSSIQTIFLPLIFKDYNSHNNHENGNLDSGQVINDNLTANGSPTGLDTTWQSGELLPGDSFSRVFDQPSYYSYQLAGSPTLSGMIIVPQPMLAAMFSSSLFVTTTSDDNTVNGNCTLREAIIAANKNIAVDACQPGSGTVTDTILLEVGTYALTIQTQGEDAAAKGDLDIYSPIEIVGSTQGPTIIDASGLSDRVFHILSKGKLSISNVTITRGSGYGGGIYNVGTLTLNNSSILSNTASGSFGGGLKNEGTATLNNSTLSGNSADYGGGIYNRAILTLNNDTLSGNTAKKYGGGIKNEGTLNLNNITISANTANDNGGGVLNYSYGKTYFKNTIIAGNTASNSAQVDCGYLSTTSQSFYSQGFNLVGPGCSSNGTGDQTTADPGLGPLQNNGGNTFTRALLPGSPAIDKGNPNGCKDSSGNLLTTDQRGQSRAVDGNNDAVIRCDIGAYEAQNIDPAQTGPVYIINVVTDANDGVCSQGNCSLREAVKAANTHLNTLNPNNVRDEIHFNISPAGPQTISLSSTLTITDPVIIDGLTQPAQSNQPVASCNPFNLLIKLDGLNAGPTADGLYISAGNTTVRGLVITHFGQNGLRLDTNGGNVVECNAIGTDASGASGLGNAAAGVFVGNAPNNTIGGTTPISGNLISGNGGAGIVISGTTASGNAIRSNTIFSNTTLGIDLGGDGVTQNDKTDPDVGPNNFQNVPVVTGAVPDNGSVVLEGWLNSTPNTSGFTLDFFANANCDPSGFSQGRTFLGSTTILTPTTANGNITFSGLSFPLANPTGQFVTATATATDATGNTSEFSACTRVDLNNVSWPRALKLNSGGGVVEQSLDKLGQSRWYKFHVDPNSRVTATLTNLPANYDLTIYKDINAAFQADLATLNGSQDLLKLNAEFAPDAFALDGFAAGARSPDGFAAGARSPDAFAPDAFSAEVFAAGARSPDAFAAGARSPDAFAAGARSPDVFAPDAFAFDAFAAGARSPDDIAAGARSQDFFAAFASAQTRSLIGVSAFEGTVGEGIIVNTWNNTGDFYVRVRGRDGAFALAAPFQLKVTQESNVCQGVSADGLSNTDLAISGDFQTLILTDLDRMPDTPMAALNAFAANVGGVVVNVHNDSRVQDANQQATAHPACPYAKNLVADAIRRIVNNYRNSHAPAYVVIVGNDNVIPFFRYQDNSLLGPESEFVPPVKDSSASQSSLKLNNVLSQDAYGAKTDISLKINEFPIPDLPVGRLVETPSDIISLLNAYAETGNGTGSGVTPAASALVTGYDFFADAAGAIKDELQAGMGTNVDTLITPNSVSPAYRPSMGPPPYPWSADELRSQLLGSRHDLVFLGGHFSAASALAADFETRMVSQDLISSTVDLKNALIYSIGCHSGYNIVNPDGILGITREPDWAQAFAQKGATLVAGTGYQYGDTDYIEYSERIYLEFTRQLRTGASVGQALVAAKQIYLAQTPEIRGLHEKSLLEATIFGLPMLKPDLLNKTSNPVAAGSIVSSLQSFPATPPSPGGLLGLQYTDVTVNPSFSPPITVDLKDFQGNPAGQASYLKGHDGIVTHPLEPTLPLEMPNVSVPGQVLRGVGFRSGSYSDEGNILPFTGAPATEIRGVHSTFFSGVFYPIRPWSINYFDALSKLPNSGITRLAVTPAQHQSSSLSDGTMTRRKFTNMNFRLYYSNNTSTVTVGQTAVKPALADAPSIIGISARPNGGVVNFKINVVGDPTAGIQEVWVTYTGLSGPFAGMWQSFNLTQNVQDSTLWEGTLNLNGTPLQDVRFMVQAVNGVGLVGLATNVGAYYIPGVDPAQLQPTALSLDTPASSGPYGTTTSLSVVLTKNGQPLANRIVTLGLGPSSRQAVTGNDGRATAAIPLLALPGNYKVKASFAGKELEAPSSATSTGTFEITKQTTTLSLNPASASGPAGANTLLLATLNDGTGLPLPQQTVFFVVSGSNGSFSVSVITDYLGRAPLGNVPLPPGDYTVNAYFNGTITLSNSSTVTLNNDRYQPSVATGSLKVTNTPPVVIDHAYPVNEDETLMVNAPGVLVKATDAESDTLSAALVSGPAHGLTLNADGSFAYTPLLNFNGTDTFTYKANDGNGDSNAATVTLTVNPVNDAPVANNDAYSVNEDTPLVITASGVLTNDTDVDGDPLTAALVSGSGPANGSLTLNANGSFTYTPNSNSNGTDSFTYKANDGTVNSNVATVTITVNPVNDAPVANNDVYTVTQKSTLVITVPGVLANDTDIDSTTRTAVLGSGPSHGSLILTASGAFTYTPVYTFYGTDTFTYKANDGSADSAVATVTITVNRLNRPPDCSTATAKPVSFWPPNKDTFILENVIGVTDPDGDPVTINITKIWQDERTGTGKYGQDGYILGPNSVNLRGERDGKGDGRVYHVFYTAHDDKGEYCEDSHGGHELEVKAGIVPHDQESNLGAVDQGPKYDSTVAK